MLNKNLKNCFIIITALASIVSCSNSGNSGATSTQYIVTPVVLNELPEGFSDLTSSLYYAKVGSESTPGLFFARGLSFTNEALKSAPEFTEIVTPVVGNLVAAYVDYRLSDINLTSNFESGANTVIAGWDVNYHNTESYVWRTTYIEYPAAFPTHYYTPFIKFGESMVIGFTVERAIESRPYYSDLAFGNLVSIESSSNVHIFLTGKFESQCAQVGGHDYISSINVVNNLDEIESHDYVAVGTANGGICAYQTEERKWLKLTNIITGFSDYKPSSEIAAIDVFDFKDDGVNSLYWSTLDGQIWQFNSDDVVESHITVAQLNGNKFINSPLANYISGRSLFVDSFTGDVYVGGVEIPGQPTKVFVLPYKSNTWQVITLPVSSGRNGVRSISLAQDNKTIVVNTYGFHSYYISKVKK